MSETSDIPGAAEQEPTASGCLLRLFWMFFGNVAWFFSLVAVARSEHPGVADATFAGIVIALVLARHLDIAKLGGMTVHAEPATREHFRRYALLLVTLSVLGWALARALSPVAL